MDRFVNAGSSRRLSDEQRAIVNVSIERGETACVVAYAGTGKTSTLVELAKARQADFPRILYVAFNKSTQTEAQGRFPAHVTCKTLSACAFAFVFKQLGKPFGPPGTTSLGIAAYMVPKLLTYVSPLPAWFKACGGETLPQIIYTAAIKTCNVYFQSSDCELSIRRHCKAGDIIQPIVARRADMLENDHIRHEKHKREQEEKTRRYQNYGGVAYLPTKAMARWNTTYAHAGAHYGVKSFNDAIHALVFDVARSIDEHIQSGAIPYSFAAFFKEYQLSGHEEPYDLIMLDEAQDNNGAAAAWLDNQKHAAKIIVGDPYQACYGWRGAVGIMDRYTGGECATLSLSSTYRFGPTLAAYNNQMVQRVFGNKQPLSSAVTARRGKMTDQGDFLLPAKLFDMPGTIDTHLAQANVKSHFITNVFQARRNGGYTYLARTNATLFTAFRFIMAAVEKYLTKKQQDVFKIFFISGGGEKSNLAELRAEYAAFTKKGASTYRFAYAKAYERHMAFKDGNAYALSLKKMVLTETEYVVKMLAFADRHCNIRKRDKACIIMATVHKSKGQEFNHVYLAPDIVMPSTKINGRQPMTAYWDPTPYHMCGMLTKQEYNLVYVAMTRARLTLHLNARLMAQFRYMTADPVKKMTVDAVKKMADDAIKKMADDAIEKMADDVTDKMADDVTDKIEMKDFNTDVKRRKLE
jgi:hypothetical protein